MSNRLRPVSTNDFRKKLKKNGFQFSRSNTGHEIWERKQSLSIPVHDKEICGGIAKRLTKEYGLKDQGRNKEEGWNIWDVYPDYNFMEEE